MATLVNLERGFVVTVIVLLNLATSRVLGECPVELEVENCACESLQNGLHITCGGTEAQLDRFPSNLPQNTVILDLSHNRIQKLEITNLLPLENLRTLKLEGNPLLCDCKLRWLHDVAWNRVKRFENLTVTGAGCYQREAENLQPLRERSREDFICSGVSCYECNPGSAKTFEDCLVPTYCESGHIAGIDYMCLTDVTRQTTGTYLNKGCVSATECASLSNFTHCARVLDQSDTDDVTCTYCCAGSLCNLFSPLDMTSTPVVRPHTDAPSTPIVLTTPRPTITPHCSAESTVDDKGRIEWPDTVANQTINKPCPYGEKRNTMARRKCLQTVDASGDRVPAWGRPDTSGCRYESPVTNDLEQLANSTLLPESTTLASQALANLSSEAEVFTETDVNFSVTVIENILSVSGNRTSAETASNLLESLDNLLAVNTDVLIASQANEQSASRLIKSVEKLSAIVEIDDDGSVTLEVDNIFVTAAMINSSTYDGMTFSVSSADDSADKSSLSRGGSSNLPRDTVESSISLPASVLEGIDQSQARRAQFIAYSDTSFFKACDAEASGTKLPREGTVTLDPGSIFSDVLNTPVIAASIGDLRITNLREPVEIVLAKQYENSSNPDCVYWDFALNGGDGGWSSEGCTPSDRYEDSDNTTICECSHLTNFAVLMDIYGTSGNISVPNQRALSVISYIGCGISLFGLLMTIITYLVLRPPHTRESADTDVNSRNVRQNIPAKILLNLCFALFFMLLVFLAGSAASEYAPTVPALCSTVAVLLHYLLLAVMFWTALEAVNMYLLLVKVFKTYIAHQMVKFCVFGWGVPLVIVAITLGINLDHYGYHNNICWLSRYAFYFGFLLPIGLILIFNSVVYALVLHQICGLNSKKLTKTERYNAVAQLKAAMSLMVLLGLTWALAVFAINEASLVVNYLFAIFNSLQGLFIFVFHCAMKVDVRKQWRRAFCPCCREADDSSGSSSTARKYKADKAKLKQDSGSTGTTGNNGSENRAANSSSRM